MIHFHHLVTLQDWKSNHAICAASFVRCVAWVQVRLLTSAAAFAAATASWDCLKFIHVTFVFRQVDPAVQECLLKKYHR